MSIPMEKAIVNGLGPVKGTPTISNSAVIGSTPVKMISGASTVKKNVRRVRLRTLSASGQIAYSIVAKGASAPSITAVGDGTSTDGFIVKPGEVETFSVYDNVDVYVVASASSTVVQIGFFEGDTTS